MLLAIGIGAVEISPLQVLTILARKIGLELPFSFTGQQESVFTGNSTAASHLGLAIGDRFSSFRRGFWQVCSPIL